MHCAVVSTAGIICVLFVFVRGLIYVVVNVLRMHVLAVLRRCAIVAIVVVNC